MAAVLVTGLLAVGAAACSNGGAPATAPTTTRPTAAPRVAVTTTTSTAATTTTPATSPAGAAPTLGLTAAFAPAGVGFGQVRPSEISLGGDPTGVLTGITWQSWGGTSAIGTGTSTYVPAGDAVAQGSQETATVVATSLGVCGGHPAYQQVSWYFPSEGQTPADNGSTPINACTGP